MLAACAARRWLAHTAAGVKLINNGDIAAAAACTSLVSCLPALEALAWCPCLSALGLYMLDGEDESEIDVLQPFPAPG